MARGEAKKVKAASSEQSSGLEIVVPSEPLAPEEQHRLEVLQRLQSYQNRAAYSVEQERAATELGLSARSLRRLQLQYRKAGIAGIKRQRRSDQEQFRVSEYWQSYILKAYREGNRGQRQTSRAQVAKQVESHASELGESRIPQPPQRISHPSRRDPTVRAKAKES